MGGKLAKELPSYQGNWGRWNKTWQGEVAAKTSIKDASKGASKAFIKGVAKAAMKGTFKNKKIYLKYIQNIFEIYLKYI